MRIFPHVESFDDKQQFYTANAETASNGKTIVKIEKAKGLDILTIIACAAAVIGGAVLIDRKLEEHL